MAALARRSPRARLYSLVPRSSQCPSISASWSGWALSHAALASSVLASPERIADESKAKYTGLRASLILYSSAGAARAEPEPAPPPAVRAPAQAQQGQAQQVAARRRP